MDVKMRKEEIEGQKAEEPPMANNKVQLLMGKMIIRVEAP